MTAPPVAAAPDRTAATETVGGALAAARKYIAPGDARSLLSHLLRRDAAYLIAHDRDALNEHTLHGFEQLVARRFAGEPVAYLTGRREFFGIEFGVTPAVLIPRPETELLVELALERMPVDRPSRLLDLGTGSGCVALSIAAHRPRAHVMAIDCSPEALAVARKNARTLELRRVEFEAGNWFAAIGDRQFDLIVANPPYVAAHDRCLEEDVLHFEPRAALCGGADGLDALRIITAGASAHLVTCGWLLLEHGHDQGPACRDLLEASGFVAVFTRRDLAGIERVSGGRFDGAQANR